LTKEWFLTVAALCRIQMTMSLTLIVGMDMVMEGEEDLDEAEWEEWAEWAAEEEWILIQS
jgi:hypothetical protein